MKTIFIWDTQIDPIKFFVVDGDHSKLDGCYINGCEDGSLVDDLNEILDYDEDGIATGVKMLDSFPVDQVTTDTKVIVAGFFQ